jgi:hypothetical protein
LIKDSFYQELEKGYDNTPSNDMNMVIRDFNAKIGKEEIYQDTVGRHNLHEKTNDNGQRVIYFAVSKDLVVSSTCFPHRDINKYTWTSPDGTTHNQIDHVLVERRNASNIMDIRTYRGADCGSDHHLVEVVYRCRTRAQKCKYHPQEPKIDIVKLKMPDKLEAYQMTAKEKLEERVRWLTTMRRTGNISNKGFRKLQNQRWNTDLDQREMTGMMRSEKAITVRNHAHKIYISRPTRTKKVEYERKTRIADKICR